MLCAVPYPGDRVLREESAQVSDRVDDGEARGAVAPLRNVDGSDQNTGWAAKMPAAATHRSANFSALPGTNTLAARHAAPMKAGKAMCQVCSPVRAACAGTHHRAQATQAQGMTLRNPFAVLVTPKPFTTVGSQ